MQRAYEKLWWKACTEPYLSESGERKDHRASWPERQWEIDADQDHERAVEAVRRRDKDQRTASGGGYKIQNIVSAGEDIPSARHESDRDSAIFYPDFRVERAYDMLSRLQIPPNERLKNLSKGTKEKVQLVLVMSRDASLYVLDEPIAGVDPASRDYILHTILSNYNREATILLSTHLIADVESILDEVVFIKYGNIILQAPAAQIRQREGKSVDRFFREVFAC